MIKKLPVNLNVGLTTECWNFIRLAALFSDKKYIPWFIEKFNNYFVDSGYNVYYYEWETTEFLSNYDEVLYFQNITCRNDIVQEAIRLINEGGYVILSYDRFYVKGSPQFQKEHEMHELLLYGYDDKLMEFDFIDANIDGILWGEHKISFDVLNCAFNSALEIINSNVDAWTWIFQTNLPASVFFLNKSFSRSPRLEVFYNAINQCLRGGETLTRFYKNNQIKYHIKRYGTSVYKSFYDDLYNILSHGGKSSIPEKDRNLILYRFKAVIENKYNLIYKLNYLNDVGLTTFPGKVIDEIKKLCAKIENAYHLLAKYSYNYDNNVLIKARESLFEIERLDTKVLTDIRDLLYDYMRQRLA